MLITSGLPINDRNATGCPVGVAEFHIRQWLAGLVDRGHRLGVHPRLIEHERAVDIVVVAASSASTPPTMPSPITTPTTAAITRRA